MVGVVRVRGEATEFHEVIVIVVKIGKADASIPNAELVRITAHICEDWSAQSMNFRVITGIQRGIIFHSNFLVRTHRTRQMHVLDKSMHMNS